MSERILPWLPDSRCYPVAQAAHFAAVTKQGWWLVGSHVFLSRSADMRGILLDICMPNGLHGLIGRLNVFVIIPAALERKTHSIRTTCAHPHHHQASQNRPITNVVSCGACTSVYQHVLHKQEGSAVMQCLHTGAAPGVRLTVGLQLPSLLWQGPSAGLYTSSHKDRRRRHWRRISCSATLEESGKRSTAIR